MSPVVYSADAIVNKLVDSPDYSVVRANFYEILCEFVAMEESRELLYSKLEELKELVNDKLKEAAQSVTDPWAQAMTVFLDMVWLEFTRAESCDLPETQEALRELVEFLLNSQLIDDSLVKQTLEYDQVDLILPSMSNISWFRRFVRLNTALSYRQQKFNLIREVGEGYSRFLAEMDQQLRHCQKYGYSDERVHVCIDLIHSLVGYFSLDYARVMDMVLDFLSNWVLIYPCSQLLLQIIRKSPISKKPRGIASLLGSKFAWYWKISKSDVKTSTLQSFYLASALLIKETLVDLNDLFPHLCPDESQIIGINSDDTPVYENEPQISCLCDAMFAIGDMENGMAILKRFPTLAHTSKSLALSFSTCLHFVFEPLYRQVAPSLKLGRLFTQKIAQSSGKELSEDAAQTESDQSHISPFPPGPRAALLETFIKSSNSIPQIHDWKQVVNELFKYLEFLGQNLHVDIYLACKICRIIRFVLAESRSSKDLSGEKAVVKFVLAKLLPALSLSRGEMGLASELWEVLKMFSYNLRFTLYGDWRFSLYDSSPELAAVRDEVIGETKKVLRRIAKENVAEMGQRLRHISISNPIICFSTLLVQIQAYDSLILPLVDAMSSMNEIGFDVMSYVLIDYLASQDKEKLKTDGTNISLWLNCLALFSANMFLKHGSMELDAVLHYIFFQGKAGNVLDMIVLKELIGKMSGFELMTEGYSEMQLEAMAGSVTLKYETLNGKMSARVEQSISRLLSALIDCKFAIVLAIILAKLKYFCMFHEQIKHLKLLSSFVDQIHDTFLHYLDFLIMNLEPKDYFEMCPSFADLCNEHGLTKEHAWYISRPRFQYMLQSPSEDKMNIDLDAKNMDSILTDVGSTVSENVLNSLGIDLYQKVWQLTLSDIYVPTKSYDSEINRIKMVLEKGLADDLDPKNMRLKKKELARLAAAEQKLIQDKETQVNRVEKNLEDIKTKSDSWFQVDCMAEFYNYCIRPRFLFSPNDATYCAKFIFLLNSMSCNNFTIANCVSIIFGDAVNVFNMASQNEAANYGRFVKEIISKLTALFEDQELPKKDGNDVKALTDDMIRWQAHLCKLFCDFLTSKKYIPIRNGIIVLEKISESFPRFKKLGAILRKKISDTVAVETREDLKLLLIRYDAALRAKADSWKDTANEELEKECLGSLIELISSPEVEDAKQEAQVEKKSASSEKLSEEKQQILQQLLKSKKEQDSRKIPDLKPLGAPQKDTYRPSTEKPKLNPHADSFKPKSKLPQSPAAEKVKEIVPTTTRNTGRNSPGNKDIISPSRQMPTDQKQDGHRSLRSNVYRPDSDRKSASNEDHNLKKDNVDLKRKPDPVVVDQSYRPSSSSGNSGRKTGERILYESPKHKSSHTYRPSDNQQQSKRSSESEPRTETAKRQKLDDRDISQRRGPTPTSTTYRPDPTQNASQTYIPSSNNRSNSNNDRKQPLPSQSDRKRGTNTSTNNGTASRPLPYRSTRQYPRR